MQAGVEVGLRGGPEEEDHDSGEEEEEEEDNDDTAAHSTSDKTCQPLNETAKDEDEDGETEDTTEDMQSALQEQLMELGVGEECSDSALQHVTSTVAMAGSASEDDEDDLGELSMANRQQRPFRSTASHQHVNTHITRSRSSDSACSTASTRSGIDHDLVKAKVKRQLNQKSRQQAARRIRKAGEAGLVTKSRREHRDNIKQSVSAVWM